MLLCTIDLPFHIVWRLYKDNAIGFCHTFKCDIGRLLASIVVGVRIKLLPSNIVNLQLCKLTCGGDGRFFYMDSIGAYIAIFCCNSNHTIVEMGSLSVHHLHKCNSRHALCSDGIFHLNRVEIDVSTFSTDVRQLGVVG